MLESLLDSIPHLGQVRKAALLKHFGSVAGIRRATLEEISEVPGIGTTIAQVIFNSLQKDRTPAFDMNTGEILEGP